MKILKTIVISVMLTLSCVAFTHATVVTFDDIPGAAIPFIFPIPDGYGSLNWYNLGGVYGKSFPGWGYDTGTVSDGWVAYSGGGDTTTTISSSTGNFVFNGAYFTSALQNNNVLTIKGYDDGALIFTVEATLNPAGPQWVAGNLAFVDQLTLSTTDKWQFAMDNFTFNETTAVPVLPSAWLLGSSLVGLVGLRRKFFRK